MPDDKTQQARPPQTPSEETNQQQDPLIGKVVGGRYEVQKQIGEGGMGKVYKAVQTGLERDVVVKVLSDDRIGDETSIKRFEREAKSLSKIDHSNIVTIHDFGQEEDLGYIVMEYVDGIRLDQLIEHKSGMPLEVLGPIAVQILDAVGEAHRLNLIHRDLKPSNIMLTERRGVQHFVKILDFGLAKLVSGATDVTADDSIVGSVPFLSPEQIKGDEVDQRVDVYALGIVFYYALTGRKPFQGSNASVLYDQVHNAPPPLHLHVQNPNAIPKEVTDLIEETLRKDPSERPRDAKEFLDRLFDAVQTPDRIAPPWMQSGDSSGSVQARPQGPSGAGGRGGGRGGGRAGGGRSAPDDASESGESPPASQEYMEAPASTSDALKQVNTASGRIEESPEPPQQQSPAGRRAAAQGGNTATVSEDDDGMSMAWFAVAAGIAAVVAVGAFAVLSGQLDLGIVASSSQTSAASGGVPASVQSTVDEIESKLAAGKIDAASSQLNRLSKRAPSNSAISAATGDLRARIEAHRRVQQGDAHVANGKTSRAKSAYEQAMQVLDDETLAWKYDQVESLGLLELDGLPEGDVVVDGKPLDRETPPLVLPSGERTVEIVKAGETQWRGEVAVAASQTATVSPSDAESGSDEAGAEEAPSAEAGGGAAEESGPSGGREAADNEPTGGTGSADETTAGKRWGSGQDDPQDDESAASASGDESPSGATTESDGSQESTSTETAGTGSDDGGGSSGTLVGGSGSGESGSESASGESGEATSGESSDKGDGPGLLPVE